MVRNVLRGLAAAVLYLGAGDYARAQSEAQFDACHQKESTTEIVGCLDGVTREADRRLNAAYQKALKSIDPSGVPALRAAERAWLEFRKQRCYYLSAGPGTIGQVVGADCVATMTKARADELEGDSKALASECRPRR